MGANENELAAIRNAGPFTAPELPVLRNSLAALAVTIKDIAASPGWQGLSASAVESYLETLSREYFAIERVLGDLQAQLDRANAIRAAALADFDDLPSAKAPAWVHGKLEEFDFPGIPDPVDLAQGGLSIIEGFLGGLREEAAGRILTAYASALEEPTAQTRIIREDLAGRTTGLGGTNAPEDDDDDTTTGSWTQGGFYQGRGYQGVEYIGGGHPPYRPPLDDVEVGVDDPNTGVLPGGGTTGPGGSTGTGGGLGGGGLGTGGLGTGIAVAGAGALAAARLGGVGAGALAGRLGAGARVGTGGLLGGGLGSAGAPATGGASRGAAGARGGSGLLGAGGAYGAGGRGADEKKKATGRGLGGPIAPRLEDDDDAVLPGEGARAGGRDDVESSGPSDD